MRPHEHDIPLGMIAVARRHIRVPELHESFRFARRHMPVFRAQLEELDSVVVAINTIQVNDLPHDMVNTRGLKQYLKVSGIQLPLTLNEDTQRNNHLRRQYITMLQEGDRLLGPFFHFHTNVHTDGRRLADAILDGYGLFVPFLLGRTGELLKSTQGLAVNALCEVLAESQVKDSGRPLRLFTAAMKSGWYKPDYGLKKEFLQRHNLWKEPLPSSGQ